MIMNHGAVNKSLGYVELPGLLKPDFKVIVELEDDEDGPQQSPGEYSVRELMMKITIGKTRLWQCIFLGWNGRYVGYFPGTDPACKKDAKAFASCPASHLKVRLRRRGWQLSTIKRLISRSFTPEAADAATHARWDSKTRKIISGGAV